MEVMNLVSLFWEGILVALMNQFCFVEFMFLFFSHLSQARSSNTFEPSAILCTMNIWIPNKHSSKSGNAVFIAIVDSSIHRH